MHEIENSETSLRELNEPGKQNSDIWTNLDHTLTFRKILVLTF